MSGEEKLWIELAQSPYRESYYDGDGTEGDSILTPDNFRLIEQVDWNYVQTFCACELALLREEISAGACHDALRDILGTFYAERVLTQIEGSSFAIEAENLTAVSCDRAVTLAGFLRDFDRCFILGTENGDVAVVWSGLFQPRVSQTIRIVTEFSRFECALLTNDRSTLLWGFVSACGSIDVTGSVPEQIDTALAHAVCTLRDLQRFEVSDSVPPIFLPEERLRDAVRLPIHEFWFRYLGIARTHLVECLKYHRGLISDLLSINETQELSAAINRLKEADMRLSLKLNPLYQMYRASTNGEIRSNKTQNGRFLPQAYAGVQ